MLESMIPRFPYIPWSQIKLDKVLQRFWLVHVYELLTKSLYSLTIIYVYVYVKNLFFFD
jgi:hypothetical protein